MSKQTTQITTLALPLTGEESNKSGNIIKKYLFHWPLFILGAILALILAFFYLKIAAPVYPISATIEFKAPTATSASLTVNQNSTEQELNPIDKPIIVENEIEIMQSKKLIYQVVNFLQLWVTYTQKKGLKSKDLYKDSPVKFEFIKQTGIIQPSGESLKIHIRDLNTFDYKGENGESANFKFSSPVKSSFGTWQLTANPNVQNYIDSTLVIGVSDPDLVSDSYQKNIKVALENKDAPFVNLSTSDQVPERGKDVLNALMALYLQYAAEDKNKLSQKALKFVDFRLDSLKTDLDSIERSIEHYKIGHGITNISLQAAGYRETKLVNDRSANDIDVQLSILSSLEKYATSNQDLNSLPAINASLGDAGLTALYDKLSDLQVKKAELMGTVPASNPMVQNYDQQINALKQDFKEKIASVRATLNAQKRQMGVHGSQLQSALATIPTLDRQYAALQRVQGSKDTIYKFLLQKREQLALRYASIVSDSEIVDDAHAGKVKWPLVPVVYGLSLILGLAAAAGLLYLRESLNDLITSRKQIEDDTSVPILGELSYQDTIKQIVVTEGRSKFAIGEQFRVLRTNLYHLHGNNDSGRVTLFTSSVSGEGKSFVSSNLAVTLAYASRKTIILEMDLRKPKISVNFGLSSEHPGISNYLADEISDLHGLIQPSGISGLDVLGSGSILPNPSELLEKDKLDELITTLRTLYDEVIIDSPPIHLVTDALIIARVADASLYVVRQGYTHKYELEYINEINEAQRFPKFTIIFNGVKAGASGYGYGYGYGYGGYNNNSYNSYAEKKKVTFREVLRGVLHRF